jgi:hypothetical protein
LDPDPELDPDPHIMNADLKHCCGSWTILNWLPDPAQFLSSFFKRNKGHDLKLAIREDRPIRRKNETTCNPSNADPDPKQCY